ncbi:MAG: tRNA pseudouridine(55) synthase TruB [Alphaproteobacteria bacterium]|nr:MAG: tRNA pseudouridine(55) synthase TruB [Alphaproteobacteria bacterium]
MARKKKGDHISGWINLDKPYGMTSTQAIGKVRRILNSQKIGHAGTLDPLATGVLPIAVGEATKTISFAQDDIKTYHFTIQWGEQRDTDDMEGKVIATSDHRPIAEDITALLGQYTGEIQQTPPNFSAIKINGERAYDIARDGNIPELKPRTVYIEELELLEARKDDADFTMICGKGTYVRSLARDIGNDLGTKGFISALRREKVGNFTAKDAISLDILSDMDYLSARSEYLLPLQIVLDDIPALDLKEEETARIRNGQALSFVSRPDFERLTKVGLGSKESTIALATHDGAPVALIEQTRADVKPVRVFNLTK